MSTSGAEARTERRVLIAALEALRDPNRLLRTPKGVRSAEVSRENLESRLGLGWLRKLLATPMVRSTGKDPSTAVLLRFAKQNPRLIT